MDIGPRQLKLGSGRFASAEARLPFLDNIPWRLEEKANGIDF